MSDTVIVLGRDKVGVVAESYGMRYYLTDCCGASATGTADYVGCRACYQPIDDRLGDVPDSDMRYVDGEWTFVSKPLALIDVYGDGITYDAWNATR